VGGGLLETILLEELGALKKIRILVEVFNP